MKNQVAFDHEKLDVYRLAIEFVRWVGELLDGPLKIGSTDNHKPTQWSR